MSVVGRSCTRIVSTDAQSRFESYDREEVVGVAARMPASEGIAHVHMREAHHEFGVVDPKGAIVDAGALKAWASSAARAAPVAADEL